MHQSFLFGVFVMCAVGAFGVAASGAQRTGASTTPAASQHATFTGCVEYGPRDSYILATMDVPAKPDLSNETALEREEVQAAEHSYELTPATSDHFSQMIGAKVRVEGTLSHETLLSAPARGAAAGRGAAALQTIDEINVSSVQKLAERCDTHPTMFAM